MPDDDNPFDRAENTRDDEKLAQKLAAAEAMAQVIDRLLSDSLGWRNDMIDARAKWEDAQ